MKKATKIPMEVKAGLLKETEALMVYGGAMPSENGAPRATNLIMCSNNNCPCPPPNMTAQCYPATNTVVGCTTNVGCNINCG